MAGRRTSLASLAGAPVEDVPGQSEPLLMSLPLNRMVPTRFNPRRRFGTEEQLREFGQKLAAKQLQPAVVVSRAGYLKLWPDEAEHVGDASYVIANGERRYKASLLVARPVLEVVHKEDVAASRASFLDAVQSENNDREDLDPIERALGIDIMVTELGGADQVAVYYGKTKGWVSQQRKLLKLTPELQDLISSGEMPIRVGRDIAGLPAEVQSLAWDEEVAKRKAAKEVEKRWKTAGAPERRDEPVGPAPRFTAVNQTPAPVLAPPPRPVPGPVAEEPRFTAVNQLPTDPVPDHASPPQLDRDEQEALAVPEPRPEPIPAGRPLPYDNGVIIAQHLILKMPEEEFAAMLRVMNRHAAEHGLDVGTPVG